MEPFPLPTQYAVWGFQNRESAMVGVWGVWGPECFGVSQFPRGPAGKLSQEEFEKKVKFSKENFSYRNFSCRKFWQRSGAGAERGGEEARQGSARKGGYETEPTAAEAATGSATRVEKLYPAS